MRIITAVICFLLGCTFTLAADIDCLLEDHDYLGGEIPGASFKTGDINECKAACLENDECVAITHAYGVCYIKHSGHQSLSYHDTTGLMGSDVYCISAKKSCLRIEAIQDGCLEEDWDYMGGDIKEFKTGDIDDCKAACLENDECVAFTYTPWSSGTCYIKDSGHQEGKSLDDAISAKKSCLKLEATPDSCLEQDVDYFGADIDEFKTEDINECTVACLKSDECVATTYTPWSGTCYLKKDGYNKKSGYDQARGCISTKKTCYIDNEKDVADRT